MMRAQAKYILGKHHCVRFWL